jgi:hypothetical protein
MPDGTTGRSGSRAQLDETGRSGSRAQLDETGPSPDGLLDFMILRAVSIRQT